MYFSMYSNVKPEKLDLSLFSVAEQTIRSPITIEDKASTERKRKEAENNVKDIYVVKKRLHKTESIWLPPSSDPFRK